MEELMTMAAHGGCIIGKAEDNEMDRDILRVHVGVALSEYFRVFGVRAIFSIRHNNNFFVGIDSPLLLESKGVFAGPWDRELMADRRASNDTLVGTCC